MCFFAQTIFIHTATALLVLFLLGRRNYLGSQNELPQVAGLKKKKTKKSGQEREGRAARDGDDDGDGDGGHGRGQGKKARTPGNHARQEVIPSCTANTTAVQQCAVRYRRVSFGTCFACTERPRPVPSHPRQQLTQLVSRCCCPVSMVNDGRG